MAFVSLGGERVARGARRVRGVRSVKLREPPHPNACPKCSHRQRFFQRAARLPASRARPASSSPGPAASVFPNTQRRQHDVRPIVKPPRQAKARKGRDAAPAPTSPPACAASVAPGEPPAPGPLVADNLDAAFVKALEADFVLHGAGAIAAMRAEKPTEYVKIIAAFRAKGTNNATDPLREMTDAELDRYIEQLAQRAGFEIRPGAVVCREDAADGEGADAG